MPTDWKDRFPESLADLDEALKDPDRIAELVSGLPSDAARVKYGSGKVLRAVAERRPELLAPHFDRFVRLLDHPNKLMQWEAIFILSHLVRVDADNRFEAVFARYFAPIRGPVMITAANVIGGGARMAAARPEWADRISREVLKVAGGRYQTAECRRIAIGQAIKAFDAFFDLVRDQRPVLRFVKSQLRCPRPATRAKASRFLKRHLPARGEPRRSKPSR